MAHIQATHHKYTREEIARLGPLFEKVCSAHGKRHPELLRMRGQSEFWQPKELRAGDHGVALADATIEVAAESGSGRAELPKLGSREVGKSPSSHPPSPPEQSGTP